MATITKLCKVRGKSGSHRAHQGECRASLWSLYQTVPTRPNFSYSWAGSRVQRPPLAWPDSLAAASAGSQSRGMVELDSSVPALKQL